MSDPLDPYGNPPGWTDPYADLTGISGSAPIPPLEDPTIPPATPPGSPLLTGLVVGLLLVALSVAVFQLLKSDDTTATAESTTTTTEAVVVREPSEVTVLVLNSTGRAGIAGSLTAAFGEAGYQTLQADNYEPTLDQSRVWYLGDFAPEAAEIQAQFVPDGVVEPYEGPDLGADIVVVLGAGYEG